MRTAQVEDAGALAELAAVTFPLACPPGSTAADQQAFLAQHLSAERFAGYAADPSRLLLVADDATGPLLGYTMLVQATPADPDVLAALTLSPTVELSKCYVHPDHHGSGVSSRLMAATLEAACGTGAAGVWLGVNQLNGRAQRFYARHGFAVVGTKHFRVGSRVEDDYVLERPL
ncbi:GNAT family N-acetyltransferase [Cellulomonas sp. SG140]|uniref:GNAT family N-acetyltransferase n=1 Tax=Cellulomonas sp. SG140 TaxID=2976536 RepID=UPI0021E8BF6E|nr:GNAT family N-acetyltransferase [Cellulomonas sp. SG140]